MTREVVFHVEAEADALQALDWYAERSPVAARAFVQELNHVISLVARLIYGQEASRTRGT